MPVLKYKPEPPGPPGHEHPDGDYVLEDLAALMAHVKAAAPSGHAWASPPFPAWDDLSRQHMRRHGLSPVSGAPASAEELTAQLAAAEAPFPAGLMPGEKVVPASGTQYAYVLPWDEKPSPYYHHAHSPHHGKWLAEQEADFTPHLHHVEWAAPEPWPVSPPPWTKHTHMQNPWGPSVPPPEYPSFDDLLGKAEPEPVPEAKAKFKGIMPKKKPKVHNAKTAQPEKKPTGKPGPEEALTYEQARFALTHDTGSLLDLPVAEALLDGAMAKAPVPLAAAGFRLRHCPAEGHFHLDWRTP